MRAEFIIYWITHSETLTCDKLNTSGGADVTIGVLPIRLLLLLPLITLERWLTTLPLSIIVCWCCWFWLDAVVVIEIWPSLFVILKLLLLLQVRLIWLEWDTTAVIWPLPLLLLFEIFWLWLVLMVIWLFPPPPPLPPPAVWLRFDIFMWLVEFVVFDNWWLLVGLIEELFELVLVISWLEMVCVWEEVGMTWKCIGPLVVEGFVISVSWSRPRRSTHLEYS